MMAQNLERVLALPEEARVLDVGGWAAPVNRADWVLDVKPYATRGAMFEEGFGPAPERFTEDTWVERDICDHEPYPFDDDFFEFVICTFTLEDLRDPIWVCREMSRIGKAGYIEVPSLFDELMWMNPEVSGGQWVGHSHHNWICWMEGEELVFVPKFHSLHSDWRTRIPRRWARRLEHEERVLAHFWEGELPAREWMAIDAYPFEELARRIRQRFTPSAAELRLMQMGGGIRNALGQVLR
jgi:SAM-dependent methyltransferase